MATQKTAKIINGPSKFDLMLALFDNKPPNRRFVTFRLGDCRWEELEVLIDKVERNDASSEQWLYAGWVRYAGGGGVACHGEYSTQDRKGTLTVNTPLGI